MSAEHGGFRHEALLYRGEEALLEVATGFVREGLAADEPVMVALPERRLRRLAQSLDGASERVQLVNMEEIGANPARIIPAWRDFVGAHPSAKRLRGIGEPIWPGRPEQELAECYLHEALLNRAFEGGPELWLICPYDASALDEGVIEEAHRCHPMVADDGVERASHGYGGADAVAAYFEAPLPPPPATHVELPFEGVHAQTSLRRFVCGYATAAGVAGRRLDDLLLAVTELTTNSIRHAGGHGTLRIWQEGDAVVCEVEDRGVIGEPLVGRQRPLIDASEGGWGLWLANQVADFVQLRSGSGGTVARVLVRRG